MVDRVVIKVADVEHNVQIPYADETKGSYSGTIIHGTTVKSGKDYTVRLSAKALGFNKALATKVKSLKPSEIVALLYTTKGNFSNLSDIVEADSPAAARSAVANTTTTGGTDFNTRAARGQALNLAVSVAVASGKHMDDKFIMGQIDRFLKLGEAVQAGETLSPKSQNKVALTAVNEEEDDEDII